VEFLPYQDERVARQFPEIPIAQFESAVQFIDTDGRVFSGAEAVFRAQTPVRRWPLRAYQHLPGVPWVTERAYRFVAQNRSFFSRLTTLFWGRDLQVSTYQWTRWAFLRALGVVYLVAFLSFWMQIKGLVGENGILPAKDYIQSLERAASDSQVGMARYFLVPTLCWFRADDPSLQWQCGIGVLLSVLVIVGIAPAPCLFLLWLIYLSLTTIGQIFLGYQWDNLLLETGFLAIFFAPGGIWPKLSQERPVSPVMLWLLRWLLFRLMFSSGCVKLLSGDPTWHNLSALRYHYETQPLPTWIGWYAFQMPVWAQSVCAAILFLIELIVPFFIFFPRRLRLTAFWLFLGLQVVIALTGNYGFFNLLTMGLCLLLLDDQALLKLVPASRRRTVILSTADDPTVALKRLSVARRLAVGVLVLFIVTLTLVPICGLFHFRPGPLVAIWEKAQSFRSVNGYGLFAVMTTSRPEIIVEGSNDGQSWLAYEFKYKPGDLQRAPGFVAPGQPRLDWQMWFAALGDIRQNPWFLYFCRRLLEGSPEVLALLRNTPFPKAPPKYLRALVYDYHFTDLSTRRRTGAWWKRELRGEYCPPISLDLFRPPAR